MQVLEDFESRILTANRLNDDGVPSASIAILHEDGTSEARVITNGKEDINTLYQACSISKAITALGVAKLIDEGKLSYSTKVIDHLPSHFVSIVENESTAGFMSHVTVAHLLSHRSGLSQHGFPGYNTDKLPTYEQLLRGQPPSTTPRIRFTTFPGAHFSYAGGGYLILQIALESLFAPLSFAELMHQTLLEPLRMTRSHYGYLPSAASSSSSTDNNNADTDRDRDRVYAASAHWTTGTRGTTNPLGHHRFFEQAAAGLWTTPTDLLRAVAAVQDSLAGRPGALLSADTAEMMLRATPPEEEHWGGGWGMGWGANGEFFAHAGDNWPGYCTYLLGSREGGGGGKRVGIAVMTDAVGGTDAIHRIVPALLEMLAVPGVARLPGGFGEVVGRVPYAAPGKVVRESEWSPWLGRWEKGWKLARDDEGQPRVSFGTGFRPVRLCPAAIAPVKSEEFRETVFVIEGMEVAVRLVESKGKKLLHITQTEFNDDLLVLSREGEAA